MEDNASTDDLLILSSYYRCQKDICLRSELFGERIFEHGSKVVMLFAEIYSFMVEKYGLNVIPSIIINYENSPSFKHWFWEVKHKLGIELNSDPTFYDIGKWIGKGLFLKICLSITHHNNLLLDESIVNEMISRQSKMLHELNKDGAFFRNGKNAIEMTDRGYILLREKTVLSYDNEYFFKDNVIY
ncbi:MAG TPA: hypothetical protein PK771_03205 [Spirochaetota bacterium]|nr:hypothetical protein [Spirochaetota bacterium]